MTLIEQRPFLQSQERKILFADRRKEKKRGHPSKGKQTTVSSALCLIYSSLNRGSAKPVLIRTEGHPEKCTITSSDVSTKILQISV